MGNIKTIADMLKGFVLAETEILNKYDIKHPTTIGTMYEGLTETILNKSIFDGLNLHVVKNSFINGCNNEFDVLLVDGDGEKIPYTERFKYNPEQIIAIIQVRKTLYSNDIKDSYKSFQFLIDYFKPRDPEEFVGKLFKDSFRGTCNKDISAKELGNLSKNEEIIYYTLMIEAFLPVRIVLGYNGFKSEFKFRESFNNILLTNTKGFGIHNFPNLIICDRYSIFKANGQPFCCPLENDWWPFYTSSSENPLYFLLELIWTRLAYKYNLSFKIFDEELSLTPGNKFISGKISTNGIWDYCYWKMDNETLIQNRKEAEWKPVELNLTQYAIIEKLSQEGEIDLKNFGNDELIEKLKQTRLVKVENNKLKLLNSECKYSILADGRYIAG